MTAGETRTQSWRSKRATAVATSERRQRPVPNTGYKNLVKLTSLGYIEGMYSKYPRIDKELIHKYHEGLIATTCCLGALVPQTILKKEKQKLKMNLNGG